MSRIKKIALTIKKHRLRTTLVILCISVIVAVSVCLVLALQTDTEQNGTPEGSLTTLTNQTPEQSRDALVSQQERVEKESDTPSKKIDALLTKAAVLRSSSKSSAVNTYKSAEKLDGSDPRPAMALCNLYFESKEKAGVTQYCAKSVTIIEKKGDSPYSSNIDLYKKMVAAAEEGSFSNASSLRGIQP